MTKLEQLIKELCPNGVEYKKLGDIATDVFRGAGITRDQVTEEGTPCVRYGEIYTTYGIYFDTCVSHTDESTIQSKKYFEHGDILFAITGESVEDIAKSTAYVGHEKCLAGGDIVVLKHNQNPKYLSYVLSTTSAQAQKSKGKVKSKVVHSSVPAIKDITIPVPPLEVQAEIVKILDEYTESVTALQQELEAELTARKKQYEYYRDLLLDLGVHGGGTSEYEWCTINDIAIKVASGKNKEKKQEGAYPVYGSTGIIAYCDKFEYNKKQILIARVGANAGYVHIADGEYDVSDNTLILDVKDSVIFEYIYYLLVNMNLNRFAKGGGQPLVTAGQIKEIKIPVPPIKEQERIVSILDRFDKLCNDISEGLPAEIEARRKQYEYYRDKLLSFEEKH